MNIETKLIKKYQLVSYILENPPRDKITQYFLNKMKKEDLIQWTIENMPNDLPKLEDLVKYENTKNFNFEKKLGLQKFTKKNMPDVAEWIKKETNVTNPYEGTVNIIDEKQDIVKLKEHQQKFLQGFLIGNLRSAITFHGVGSGKTLTAVATARMYLQIYPNNFVIVITPTAVLYNFLESMVKFGVDPRDRRYSYFSYDKWMRSKKTANNALLIVDEAHNLRTLIVESKKEDKHGVQYTSIESGKKAYEVLTRGGKPAHKVMLLTGTPFVNSPYDIENLLAIGEGRDPHNPDLYGKIVSNKEMRYDYFKYRISNYNTVHDDNFPERSDKLVPLVVDRESELGKEIRAQSGKDNPFYIKTRSGTLDSMKWKYIMSVINKNKDKKYVVYTSLQKYGVKPLEEYLKESKVSYGVISGLESTGSKKDNITDYNENKIKVLIITRAGAEGISLTETRGIFITDGQWNDALYEQIVARSIRYRSHINLPKNEQYVDVYKLFLCYDSEAQSLEKIKQGKFDFTKFINSVMEIRKKLSKDKKGDDGNDDNEENDFLGDDNFDEEELNNLKKDQRHKYIEDKLVFGKDRAKYRVNSLVRELPSIDFYMFCLQKTKQAVIDKFIKQLHDIPTLEKSIYDLPIGKELFKKIENNKINGVGIMETINNYLRPKIAEVEKIISKDIDKKGKSKLQMYVEKKQEIASLQDKKKKLHIRQEYFTPMHIAKEFVLASQIQNSREKNLRILEPTAGYGNIIQVLLEIMSKHRKNLDIDMIEILDDNRKFLQEYCDKIPDVLHLLKTKDFLEFVPSELYDYIFMNPPFLLNKSKFTTYNNDVYDYDFVKRAFACLHPNSGYLMAITSTAYKRNKDIMKWYKDHDAEIYEQTVSWKGEGLKEGAEIGKMEIAMIKIKKFNEDEDEELLKINFLKKNDLVSFIKRR